MSAGGMPPSPHGEDNAQQNVSGRYGVHGLSCVEADAAGLAALCMGQRHGMGNVATCGRSRVTKGWLRGTPVVGEGWATRAWDAAFLRHAQGCDRRLATRAEDAAAAGGHCTGGCP